MDAASTRALALADGLHRGAHPYPSAPCRLNAASRQHPRDPRPTTLPVAQTRAPPPPKARDRTPKQPTTHLDHASNNRNRANHAKSAVARPVTETNGGSRLSARTFKRRFRAATGETTISYVQRIRVERAKRVLETGNAPIEKISWAVGYEDPASFRRLFKRLTGLTPGDYRRRFQLPDLPHIRAEEPLDHMAGRADRPLWV